MKLTRAAAPRLAEGLAELAAFAALAAFGALTWSRMLADPPLGRILGSVVLATALLAVLLMLGRAVGGRARLVLGSVAVTAVAFVLASLVAGIEPRLLAPARWDELGPLLADGLARAGQVEMPYGGDDASVPLVLLTGQALLVVLAAALAGFGRRERPRALAGLVGLLVVYGVGVALVESGGGFVRALALVALVAVWVWTCSERRPRFRPALVAAAALALVASLLGARAAAGDPGWDYRDWDPFGGERSGVSFDWNHSYGPFEWPQEGTEVLRIEADGPAYWKASVLDRFDGVEWVRAEGAERDGLQTGLPYGSEPSLERDSNLRRHSDWLRSFDVRVLSLESPFAIVAGQALSIYGLDGGTVSADGTVELEPEPLGRGDEYTVDAYVPDPTTEQLERQPSSYDPGLAAYTSIDLPAPEGSLPQVASFPPLGSGLGGERRARREVGATGYAGVLELTDEVTAGAETSWERVRAVRDFLAEPQFTYFQSVTESELPLATFLLDDPRGYCQQFSGAMALMLRMSGVPTRVVSGFAPGEPTGEGEEAGFTVTDREAHSWVEVYFERIGWVAFDPTPPAAPASREESSDSVAIPPLPGGEEAGDGLSQGRDEPQLDGGSPPPALEPTTGTRDPFPAFELAGGAALLGLLAATGIAYVRRRRLDRLGADGEIQLAELADALRRLGWRPRPGETLAALERRLRRDGATDAAAYVDALSRARYSPGASAPPSASDRRRLRRSLAARRGPRARLAGLLAIPPGGPAARHVPSSARRSPRPVARSPASSPSR
ncbi:hypothetical protein HJD18_00235 [Thermoleophilia bacterium SCSIO 60948]|nr:hypothetical protein HJD18_00235 [Thermoleophilia bacterium SCSIO 60948]